MLKTKTINWQTGVFQEKIITPETMPNGEYFIGRFPSCDFILNSPEVSRLHARIFFRNGQYFFSDLCSTDGSRINGQEINLKENYLLQPDQIIQIAEFAIRIEAIEPPIGDRLDSQSRWSSGDITLRCQRIISETPDVKTFCFVADPPVLFDYKPGQFVTLDLKIDDRQVLRCYSISSSPSRPHNLEITVKRVPPPNDAPNLPPGLVSNWLHDRIEVGSEIKLIGGPMGEFTCVDKPATNNLLMISAGSGITPLMSMSRWLYDTKSECDIVFFHSAKSPGDIIFRQELELMAARQSNFRLAITTTQPLPDRDSLGFTGRLNETMLRMIAPDFLDRTVYVCGPDGFMEGIRAMLESLSFPMQNYYQESFGSSNKSQTAASVMPNRTQPVVVFAQSGKEATSDGEKSILELAKQQQINIHQSCGRGFCGACKQLKLEGEVKYQSEPKGLQNSERENGYILTCVAYPIGRVVLDS